MMSFNFISSNRFNLDDFRDIEKFVDTYPDFQTITLNNEIELNLLLRLMGIQEINSTDLEEGEFSKYWDLSDYKLPEFNEEQFSNFYRCWIDKSNRNNNMDEYGNLIFLNGLSSKWNKLDYRLIVKEED